MLTDSKKRTEQKVNEQKKTGRMKAKLTEGSVNKTLIKLTIPMIWGLFAIIFISLVDTYFVGKLGTKELAAITFTFPIVMIAGGLSIGLGIGTSSVISRAIGEGNYQKVRRLTTDSLIISLIIVGICVILGLLTIHPLFTLMGASKDTLPLIDDYMKIWYIGMIFVVVPMVGNSAIRATGDTFFPSMIMILSSVINSILDPLFIFGIWGFPNLGIKGAAIAAVIAKGASLIAAILILHFRERMLDFSIPKFKELIESWKLVLYIGIPAAAANIIMPISLSIIISLISKHGSESIAAFGIATRIEAMVLIILMSLSSSIGPFVGQNWGANNPDRVIDSVRACFRFSIFFHIAIALALAIFAVPLSTLFNKDMSVISISAIYLFIVPISYGLEGIRAVTTSVFNALGKPIEPIIITFARMFVLYIPFAILLDKFIGIVGIFISASLSSIIIGIVSFIWIKNLFSKNNLVLKNNII